ncbi:MAG: type 4a pilus biogenesis protein PilO [Candidatus Omnitrophota bacterium]
MELNKGAFAQLKKVDALELFLEHKNKIVNIAVIILALFIAFKIHAKQVKVVNTYKGNMAIEKKKNVLLGEIDKLIVDLSAYGKVLPSNTPEALMNTLSGIAQETGVKIFSIKPGDTQVTGDYLKTPIYLTISCPNYNVLGKFISGLENSAELFQVESISVSFEGGKEGAMLTLIITNIAFKK